MKDGAHTFAVVRVTDDRMSVVSYDWDHVFDKRLPIKKL